MADARKSENWDHTSMIWALTAEVNRDRKKRLEPYTAYDVHPYATKSVEEEPAAEPATEPTGEEIVAAAAAAAKINALLSQEVTDEEELADVW